jgi:O-antigen/teichoic acid export membrane protein
MHIRLQVVLDAIALLIAKAAFIGIRLSALYVVAGRVEAATFGSIALAMTAAEIARVVGDWGSDTLSLRKFSDPLPSRALASLRWVARLRVVSSVVAVLLAALAITFLVGLPFGALTVLLSLTAATSLWLNLGVNWLQARGVLRPASALLFVSGLASLTLQIGMARAGASVVLQFGALVGSELVMVALVLAFTLRRIERRHALGTPVDDSRTVAPWFSEATPIAIAALLAMTYTRFDQFYMKEVATGAVLGDYTLAMRLVEPLMFMAAALSSTIYARASALVLSGENDSVTRRTAFRWVAAMVVGAAIASLLTGLIGWFGLPRWFPAYADTRIFMSIALADMVFRAANLCLTAFIQAAGRYTAMMRISMCNALFVPLLVVVGHRWFGNVGIAVGMAVADAVNAAIQLRMLATLKSSGPPGRPV